MKKICVRTFTTKCKNSFFANIMPYSIVLSFILTYWVIFIDPTINLDGILYIRVAEYIYQGEWGNAYQAYSWIFYPCLIAILSKITTLGLESSAHLLTALFSSLLTYAFIGIIKEFSNDKKLLAFAAVIIVLHPEFNETRAHVLRDHGYLAFYLVSLLFLFRHYLRPTWASSFYWSISILIATLFRIEGLVILVFLPLVIFFRQSVSFRSKLYGFFQANFINFILLCALSICYLFNPLLFQAKSGRLLEPFSRLNLLYNAISTQLAFKAEIVSNSVLDSSLSGDYAFIVVLTIPIILILGKLIKVLTPFYLCVFLWGGKYLKRLVEIDGVAVFAWAVGINLIILIVFVLPQFFLQFRFVMPLALICMLLLPPIMCLLWNKLALPNSSTKSVKSYLLFCFLAVLFLLNSIEGVVKFPGYSKKYIRDAGRWIESNVPQEMSLYTNNRKIYYYSGRLNKIVKKKSIRKPLDIGILETKPWRESKYIALYIRHDYSPSESYISHFIGHSPIKQFWNKRNDGILIYKLLE